MKERQYSAIKSSSKIIFSWHQIMKKIFDGFQRIISLYNFDIFLSVKKICNLNINFIY